MAKFNVGDQVRVKEDLVTGSFYNENTLFVSGMEQYKGKIVTIDLVDHDGTYRIKEDGGEWWYADDMLEPIDASKPKFKVGDRVRGNAKADERYRITTSDMLGEVIVVDEEGFITVRVLEHSSMPEEVRRVFYELVPECFDLVGGTPKFKVGDKVRGNAKADKEHYYTTSDALMEVVKVFDDGKILVKIFSHNTHLECVGDEFRVDADYLELAQPDTKTAGTILEVTMHEVGAEDEETFIALNCPGEFGYTEDCSFTCKECWLRPADGNNIKKSDKTEESSVPTRLFKPGDKVRMRDDLVVGKVYGGIQLFDKMAELKGKVVTVSDVVLDKHYLIEESRLPFIYSRTMFVPAEETKPEKAHKESMSVFEFVELLKAYNDESTVDCKNVVCDDCPLDVKVIDDYTACDLLAKIQNRLNE